MTRLKRILMMLWSPWLCVVCFVMGVFYSHWLWPKKIYITQSNVSAANAHINGDLQVSSGSIVYLNACAINGALIVNNGAAVSVSSSNFGMTQ